jgi:hypothetical protein
MTFDRPVQRFTANATSPTAGKVREGLKKLWAKTSADDEGSDA